MSQEEALQDKESRQVTSLFRRGDERTCIYSKNSSESVQESGVNRFKDRVLELGSGRDASQDKVRVSRIWVKQTIACKRTQKLARRPPTRVVPPNPIPGLQ